MLSNRIPETSTNLDQKIQKTFKLFDEEKSTPNKSHWFQSQSTGGKTIVLTTLKNDLSLPNRPFLSVPFPCQFFSRTGKVHSRNVSLGPRRWWRDDAATSPDLDLRPRLTERQSPSSHDGREGCQRQSGYVNIPTRAVINARFKLLERVLIRFEVLSGRIKASVTNKLCSSGWT